MSTENKTGAEAIARELTTDEARTQCRLAIRQAYTESGPILIEAPPSLGKSLGVVYEAARAGIPVTILTSRTDLYDQIEGWCEECGLDYHILASPHRDCPTMKDKPEHGENWQQDARRKYDDGVSGLELHKNADQYFQDELPCQHEGKCPYIEKLSFNPSSFDVIIGNYSHAYKSEVVDNRYVVFDEFPEGLTEQISGSRFMSAVSHYLSGCSELPFDNYRDFLNNRSNYQDPVREWVKSWEESFQWDRNGPINRAAGSTHTSSPLWTYAALTMDLFENDWGRSSLPNSGVAVQNPDNGEVTILTPPNLDNAEGVMALDGTPSVLKWKLVLGDELEHRPVLNDEEKQQYLSECMGLTIVQTSEYPKPSLSGQFVCPPSEIALIEGVGLSEGRRPGLIASHKAIEMYERKIGNEEFAELVHSSLHFNEMKGTNDFSEIRVGLVIGCPQPSDLQIQMWAALAGYSVERVPTNYEEEAKGNNFSFGPIGDEILNNCREDEVLQSFMRFGRKEVDGVKGAIVFVHTCAIPEWVRPIREIADIKPMSDGREEVIQAIKGKSRWTTPKIANEVDCVRRNVLNHLNDLAKEGHIEKHGKGPGTYWKMVEVESAGKYGVVDFSASN